MKYLKLAAGILSAIIAIPLIITAVILGIIWITIEVLRNPTEPKTFDQKKALSYYYTTNTIE